MKKVVLIFPDTEIMFEFIVTHNISNAEVNSSELSLTTMLNDEQIVLACTRYKAILRTKIINNKLFDT